MIPTTMLQELAKDKSLSPQTLRVYFILVGELDFTIFRHVKQQAIADAIEAGQATVSRVLQALADKALIECGPRDGAGNTYRLVRTNPYNVSGKW